MAIAFVNYNTEVNGTSNDLTVASEYTSAAADDYVLLFATHSSTDGSYTVDVSWTGIEVDYLTAGTADVGLWWLKHTGTPLTAAQRRVQYSGTADSMRVTIMGFSGVHTSTPFDVTYSQASHLNSTLNDGTTNTPAQPIATATNDAMVVLVQHLENHGSTMSASAPTNYALNVDLQVNDRCHEVASRLITSFGTETPGNWNHSGQDASTDNTNITLALKPAVSAYTIEVPTGPWY